MIELQASASEVCDRRQRGILSALAISWLRIAQLQGEDSMERRAFGKTGMTVSALGFGGAEIGFRGVAQDKVDKLLGSALESGLNVIDTAECYANSEELIGKAVSNRRQEFYLLTKVGHAGSWGIDDWSKSGIEKSIDRSLKRLKTDYVDLVQLHSCDEEMLRKGEVVEALVKARAAGKTRHIGYSGDGMTALYAVNMDVFDTLQTSVSIADQQSIELTVPEAERRGMGVIVKRPIANAAWRLGSKPVDEYSKPYFERLKELKYDFINGDMQSSIEVALRFTLTVPGVHTAIVGTTQPGRWQENATLLAKGPLPPAQFEAIRLRWKAVSSADWVGQI
jgi:aryl-alcohol dehydrogenase-like predicted oxidoreductase